MILFSKWTAEGALNSNKLSIKRHRRPMYKSREYDSISLSAYNYGMNQGGTADIYSSLTDFFCQGFFIP